MNERPQSSFILLVPTKVLILIAAGVWFAAGSSVAMVGLKAPVSSWTWVMLGGAAVVFGLFLILFLYISRRNIQRILSDPEPLSFILRFFDVNSYMIMAVMIFLGAAVRFSTFVPEWIIAFFYCGLGTALVFAGFYMLISYIQAWEGQHFTV
ncbi:MAG: hypothetical protein LBG68_04650 [Coriobacteriales bacterium]|jgi:hypothetical protein|nr:hypothetical protein [Coriobacteriales bacterium]